MCEEKVLYVGIATMTYNAIKQVVLDEFCNAVTIKNTGTTIALIGEDPLNPGESKFFGGNRNEIIVMRFDIKFRTQVPPPATIINEVQVTQKFYINNRKQ